MQIVPLAPVPWQTLAITLANQACRLDVYQRGEGMFVNLAVNDAVLVGGVAGQNRNRMVRSAYLGFAGDLAFLDTQGGDDPQYTGLGSRWLLFHLSPDDVAAAIAAGALF
jgi:hypothetical protein